MIEVLVGLEALIILLLLAALLYGQPAAATVNVARIEAQQTEVSVLRARVNVVPTPTSFRKGP